MVAYSVQPEFVAPILAGVKVSTMRPPRLRGHVQPGQPVHLFSGLRTPDAVRLLVAPCVRSEPVEVHAWGVVAGGERKVNPAYFEHLARIEGFSSFGNLQAWFDRRYGLPVVDLTRIEWDFRAAEFVAGAVP